MEPYIFETIMLVCFGAGWPFSIYAMLKTRQSRGKSIPFLIIILTGYVSGICYQYFGERNDVIFLYILNTALVSIDLALTLKFRDKPAPRRA
jgi:hypothetical protein